MSETTLVRCPFCGSEAVFYAHGAALWMPVCTRAGCPASRYGAPSEGWDEHYAAGQWAATLFCARVRKMRPQRPIYRDMPAKLKPLFDACGPERDPKSEG